jgi:hypothetical protein
MLLLKTIIMNWYMIYNLLENLICITIQVSRCLLDISSKLCVLVLLAQMVPPSVIIKRGGERVKLWVQDPRGVYNL